MAILITGGKGFIGSNLKSFLISKGEKVLLLEGDISSKRTIDLFNPKEKIYAVVHLAAVINKKEKGKFENINIQGTKNVLDLCYKLKIKKIIFLSSIRTLSRFNDPYTDSKRKAEELIISSGITYIILRPSMVYGPGDKKNIGLITRAAKTAPFMPMFDFQMQPIFIDDMIKIISSCLSLQTNSVLNIVGPEIIKFKDLLQVLRLFGYRFYIINLPSFFSFVIKIFSFLPFSPIRYWQIKSLFSDELFKGDDWQKLFKISPTHFSDGLAKTIK